MLKTDARHPATTGLVLDVLALNEAIQDSDVDEARFRVHLVLIGAMDGGHDALANAATHAHRFLGPPGSQPHHGHLAAVARITEALGRIV
jgi:hypothetical protein